jgi:Tfp pilus assembly protein PilZ
VSIAVDPKACALPNRRLKIGSEYRSMSATYDLSAATDTGESSVPEDLLPVPDTVQKKVKGSIRNQILELVDRMPEEMQAKLLDFLQARLPRRIRGNLVIEKRADFRRDCLVSLEYHVDGASFEGFILDISAFGVFVESDEKLPVGKPIRLSFSLPGYPAQLNLSGKIVWSGSQGFGVRFNFLTRDQEKMIRSFSEKEASVYTIVS